MEVDSESTLVDSVSVEEVAVGVDILKEFLSFSSLLTVVLLVVSFDLVSLCLSWSLILSLSLILSWSCLIVEVYSSSFFTQFACSPWSSAIFNVYSLFFSSKLWTISVKTWILSAFLSLDLLAASATMKINKRK